MTGCICKGPGWCERHKCLKTENWFLLCQRSEAYFRKWEEGRGPGQGIAGKSEVFYPGGPGTELKKILARYWIVDKTGCNCKEHATTMDRWGPEMCRKRMATILAWLKEEAQERRLPFIEIIARRLVLKAIRNAEKLAAAKLAT